jgi:hypothetical protein
LGAANTPLARAAKELSKALQLGRHAQPAGLSVQATPVGRGRGSGGGRPSPTARGRGRGGGGDYGGNADGGNTGSRGTQQDRSAPSARGKIRLTGDNLNDMVDNIHAHGLEQLECDAKLAQLAAEMDTLRARQVTRADKVALLAVDPDDVRDGTASAQSRRSAATIEEGEEGEDEVAAADNTDLRLRTGTNNGLFNATNDREMADQEYLRFTTSKQAAAARAAMVEGANLMFRLRAAVEQIVEFMVLAALLFVSPSPAMKTRVLQGVPDLLERLADDVDVEPADVLGDLGKAGRTAILESIAVERWNDRHALSTWLAKPRFGEPMADDAHLECEDLAHVLGVKDKTIIRSASNRVLSSLGRSDPPEDEHAQWTVMLGEVRLAVVDAAAKSAEGEIKADQETRLTHLREDLEKREKEEAQERFIQALGLDADGREAFYHMEAAHKLRVQAFEAQVRAYGSKCVKSHEVFVTEFVNEVVNPATLREFADARAAEREPREIHLCLDPLCRFVGTLDALEDHERTEHPKLPLAEWREDLKSKPIGLPNHSLMCALATIVTMLELSTAHVGALAKKRDPLGVAFTERTVRAAMDLATSLDILVGVATSPRLVIERLADLYPKVKAITYGTIYQSKCVCGAPVPPTMWRGVDSDATTMRELLRATYDVVLCEQCRLPVVQPRGDSECVWVNLESSNAPIPLGIEDPSTGYQLKLLSLAYAQTRNHLVALAPPSKPGGPWTLVNGQRASIMHRAPDPKYAVIALYIRTEAPRNPTYTPEYQRWKARGSNWKTYGGPESDTELASPQPDAPTLSPRRATSSELLATALMGGIETNPGPAQSVEPEPPPEPPPVPDPEREDLRLARNLGLDTHEPDFVARNCVRRRPFETEADFTARRTHIWAQRERLAARACNGVPDTPAPPPSPMAAPLDTLSNSAAYGVPRTRQNRTHRLRVLSLNVNSLQQYNAKSAAEQVSRAQRVITLADRERADVVMMQETRNVPKIVMDFLARNGWTVVTAQTCGERREAVVARSQAGGGASRWRHGHVPHRTPHCKRTRQEPPAGRRGSTGCSDGGRPCHCGVRVPLTSGGRRARPRNLASEPSAQRGGWLRLERARVVVPATS